MVISNPPALLRKHGELPVIFVRQGRALITSSRFSAELLKTLFIVSDVSLVDETPTPSAEWHFSSGKLLRFAAHRSTPY